MTEKKIIIAGQEVGVKYCFATEIGFRDLTGVTVDEFDFRNPSQAAAFVMSAIIAYYQSRSLDAPLDISAIIYDSKPKEIVDALNTIYSLSSEWYAGDSGAREEYNLTDEEKGELKKNA